MTSDKDNSRSIYEVLLEGKVDDLRKRCADLEAALKPFAAFASVASSETMKKLGMDQSRYQIDDEDIVATGGRHGTDTYRVIRFVDLRRAAALIPSEQKGDADGK